MCVCIYIYIYIYIYIFTSNTTIIKYTIVSNNRYSPLNHCTLQCPDKIPYAHNVEQAVLNVSNHQLTVLVFNSCNSRNLCQILKYSITSRIITHIQVYKVWQQHKDTLEPILPRTHIKTTCHRHQVTAQ